MENLMKFKLIKKDYKTERYEADLGQGLTASVVMYYHTHLKYWDVIYKIGYPPYYQTEHIFGKAYIDSRKEARNIAQQVMNSARPDDWKTKLSEFYQNEIKKSFKPNFL
jgi:hypothetical protein